MLYNYHVDAKPSQIQVSTSITWGCSETARQLSRSVVDLCCHGDTSEVGHRHLAWPTFHTECTCRNQAITWPNVYDSDQDKGHLLSRN